MAAYENQRFPVPEAHRLASLGSVREDLLGVIAYCELLASRAMEEHNSVEWEAISSAAVVRYARCFASGGVRDSLSHSIVDLAPSEYLTSHQFFIAMRNKHVAHSVNPFEENEVTLVIGSHFLSAKDITGVGAIHGRMLGLPHEMLPKLAALCAWVLAKVNEEIAMERTAILQVAHRYTLGELRAFGSVVLGEGADEVNVNKRRIRP